jgi:hypothetical protein
VNDCAALPQWQRADRLRNLAIAAKAGVPGAAYAFYGEGPVGEGIASTLQSRPSDVTAAWKDEAIGYVRRDALKGDINAMAKLAEIYQFEDRKLALAYAEATSRVKAQTAGKPSPQWERLVASLAQGMPAADVAAAKAIAADVVAQCCSRSAVSPAGKEPK